MDGDITSMFEDKRKIIHFMGCGAGRAYLISGEIGVNRAYIGLEDDGKIGEGDEGSEGTGGRLPLYKKASEESNT